MAYIGRRYAGWFDGVDDKVQVANTFDFNSPVTVFVVFRPINKLNANSICGSFNDNSSVGYNGWFLRVQNGNLNLEVWDAGTKYSPSFGAVTLGKRYAVGIVSYGKGNGADVYVDGVKVGTHSYGLVHDVSAFMIGQRSQASPSSTYFNGDIYAVYVWNRTLSDIEIAKLNEDPFNPDNVPRDGLVGWWDFNRADWNNGILPDLSGNGNDGTIYGVVQRDVLVKRGTGDLPKYELTNSWVCDGIDDYVIVDFNNWAVTKALSFAVWNRNYAGSQYVGFVSSAAKGIGSYDATKNAWRVDAGEVGYFLDKEVDYNENKFGRGIWFYVRGVEVDDNSQSVPLFRFEVVDANTGEVVFSKDYTANQFPVGNLSYIVTAGHMFLPYGRYKLRLYSYGNVGFWIQYAEMEGYHGALLFSYGSLDFRIYRYYGYSQLLVWKTDGTHTDISYGDTNIRDWEHLVVGWSNPEQKFTMYINGQYIKEVADTTGLDMRGVATRIIIGASNETTVNNRYTGEIASIMMFDRLLSDIEVSDLYNKKFVLDGLVHWWVVDENGNLVDLVTGKSYVIQGNPYIRRLYDSSGKLNSGTGVVVFDIIEEERGV